MAQLTKIVMPDGRVLVPGDWTSAEPLYSTVEIAAGSIQTLTAFSYALGGTVPGSIANGRNANIRDTNLQGEGSRLPENEELVVYNIMVELYGVNTADMTVTPYDTDTTGYPTPDAPFISLLDVLRVQRDTVIVMNIAAIKQYTKQPLGYFPASTGVDQVNSGGRTVGGTTGFIIGDNGGVDAGSQRTLASPLYVAGGESFNVEFLFPFGSIANLNLVANGRIRAVTYLDGYRKRPVA